MRTYVIPAVMTLLTVVFMIYQARTVEPVLTEPPAVRLPEIAGFVSEAVEPSEAELQSLPSDTQFVKRRYRDAAGAEYMVSVVIGGRSKSSIHRPELCLPSQGFQMLRPRQLTVGGVSWHCVTIERGSSFRSGFAYTFFNQAGFRTSSHLRRIFRDVWDRSVLGRIDRWVMVTVSLPTANDGRMAGFLRHFKEVIR